MAQLLAAPYSYFADANGAPLAGGKVYTYAAGTTTPQASYTDSSGSTPAANPVVLDSGGKSEIWLSGSYKIIVKDSLGNTIHTTDNITPSGGGGGGGSSFTDAAFSITNSSDATKKVAFDASAITTGTTRTVAFPDKNGTIAMTSDISGNATSYQITDSTDISLSQVATWANIGASKAIVFPVKGMVDIEFIGDITATTAAQDILIAIKIGSTVYCPTFLDGATPNYAVMAHIDNSSSCKLQGITGSSTGQPGSTSVFFNQKLSLSIEGNSVPTGTQTVQMVMARLASTNSCTVKGTTDNSIINITVRSFS